MPDIRPCLWFDDQALEAAEFYTGIFPNSRIVRTDRAASDYPSGQEGDLLTVEFELDGLGFTGLNGGPDFTFNEAISLEVPCRDQAEVDRYWTALTADGGEPGECGWLKDRFGVSWQVYPVQLNELLRDEDKDAARRTMEAMLKMGKLELEGLRRAHDGA
jgi:predicted 3-demethylubiquinone-9 3-methyltransferase (glyoxalase superfamily)